MKKLVSITLLIVIFGIFGYPQSSFGQMKFRSISMSINEDGKEGETMVDNSMIFIENETVKIIDEQYTLVYYILKFNSPQTNENGDVFWKIDCVTESGVKCTILLGKYQGYEDQSSIHVVFQDVNMVYLVKDLK
jgi:hypothetical protein